MKPVTLDTHQAQALRQGATLLALPMQFTGYPLLPPYSPGDRVRCKEALNILDWDDSEARRKLFERCPVCGMTGGSNFGRCACD